MIVVFFTSSNFLEDQWKVSTAAWKLDAGYWSYAMAFLNSPSAVPHGI